MTDRVQLANPRLAGVLTLADLRAAGVARPRLRTLVRRGDLVLVRRGVYVSGAEPCLADPAGRQVINAVALAATTRGTAISHQSAALVYGIDLIGQPGERPTLTRLPGRNLAGLGASIYGASLPLAHVRLRQGVLITTPARTVIDLGRILPFAEGVVAADSAIQKGLANKSDLLKVLATCRKSPGAATAARVVSFANGLAESPLESLARVLFDEAGLPAPALQQWISLGSTTIGRVDFLWERLATIAEVDGNAKYQDPARARAQLWRDKKLRAAGYQVEHFDWREITTQPDAVVAALQLAFQRGLAAS